MHRHFSIGKQTCCNIAGGRCHPAPCKRNHTTEMFTLVPQRFNERVRDAPSNNLYGNTIVRLDAPEDRQNVPLIRVADNLEWNEKNIVIPGQHAATTGCVGFCFPRESRLFGFGTHVLDYFIRLGAKLVAIVATERIDVRRCYRILDVELLRPCLLQPLQKSARVGTYIRGQFGHAGIGRHVGRNSRNAYILLNHRIFRKFLIVCLCRASRSALFLFLITFLIKNA